MFYDLIYSTQLSALSLSLFPLSSLSSIYLSIWALEWWKQNKCDRYDHHRHKYQYIYHHHYDNHHFHHHSLLRHFHHHHRINLVCFFIFHYQRYRHHCFIIIVYFVTIIANHHLYPFIFIFIHFFYRQVIIEIRGSTSDQTLDRPTYSNG